MTLSLDRVVQGWLQDLTTPFRPDEADVKELLTRVGIETPRRIRLNSNAPLKAVPWPPPYAVKACSPEILHKTDIGAVVLEVNRRRLQETVDTLRRRFPDTAILIEEQIRFCGPELIVGGLVDPVFGPAVMVGTGGILTEVYEDVAFRLAPCHPDETRRMLSELTVAPALFGFRGIPSNPDQLASIITTTGGLALALGTRFSQLDINPLVLVNGRWVALDAKLVLTPDDGSH